MARLPYLSTDDVAEEDKVLLSRDINLAKILAHSPQGARAFNKLGGFIRSGSKLDPGLREMAILRVGVLARAPYEFSHHVKIGRDVGLTDDDIERVMNGPRAYDEDAVEHHVLSAADEMTNIGAISPETFVALTKHLNAELLVDLCLVISFYNAVVRFLASLEIDVEPDYENFLEQFPL